jgi:hypothetical protein
LLGDEHLGHPESLQGQFRLAAIDVKHRVENQDKFEAERVSDVFG